MLCCLSDVAYGKPIPPALTCTKQRMATNRKTGERAIKFRARRISIQFYFVARVGPPETRTREGEDFMCIYC